MDVLAAIEAGREVVRRCPDSLADIEALAQLLARTEQLEESLTWIDRAIVQEPNVASYHRLRASLLERITDFKAAYQAVKRSQYLDSTNIELVNDGRRIFKKLLIQRTGLTRLFGSKRGKVLW